jgi:hypothetical protein
MKTHKILWGLLILGCGVMLLLAALGLGEEYEAVRIIGSVLLLGIAITSIIRIQWFMAVLPLALIAYLWRIQLGFPNLDFWLLLASAVVLGIGLSIIFHKKNRHFNKVHRSDDWSSTTEEVLSNDEVININSNFGEHTKYIHADGLKRVNISSSFSSVKVYFDQCQPSSEGLVINVSSNFAGVVLTMPRSWNVENHINTFAAEVNDRDGTRSADGCKVMLKGSVNFAEVKLLRV